MIENFSRQMFRGSSGTYNVYALELAATTFRKFKGLELTVHFLDRTEHVFHVDKRSKGSVLLDLVYHHLELVEKDYFGLQYPEDKSGTSTECMIWLDPSKTLKKQLTNCQTNLYFRVKFYVSDPSKLQHEYTRYQFYLQIKKDIFEERLLVPPSTSILLASYMVQSELGDYCPEEHDKNYLSNLQLIPGQTPELEENIMELHKLHKGKLPAVAEFHFLDHAKKIDMYGVDLHNALDSTNKSIQLGVTHMGLVIFRNNIKLNTFSWSKIMKISFKRKQFFIQLRREPSEDYDTVLVFNMESYRSAKKLWKSCVEHHTFFRLHSPKVKRKFPFSLGSKFSYSGRTEIQTVIDVQQRGKIEHKFVRSPSRQIVKHIISTGPSMEEKTKTFLTPNRSTRSYDNKVTSLGSKGPRKAWGAESQISSEDGDNLEKPIDAPFSPGKILSYADDDIPSPVSNGLYDTPPYSASHSPVSQMVEEPSVSITLFPDAEGKYGFNVKGGVTQSLPIVVMRVAPNTPADTCTPRLSEGDQILQINGKDMSTASYEEAVKLIQEARTTNDGKLVLQVKPNVIYSGLDDYEEPPYQYVPLGDVQTVQSGNVLEQSMLLLADGLASGAVVVRFETLYRKHPDMTCDEALKPKNINKNRYRDISPYDTTRVILKNDINGDYINANYVNMTINGTEMVNRYIATQGPLQSTTDDFWQMIFEEKCTLIIMLTTLVERGRTKCHKYWPSVGECLTVQNTTVKCIKEETDLTGSVVYRDFILTDGDTEELREIKHIQYVVWPDHGVPASPSEFLSFTDIVREARKGDAPVVVHCSAGIGRTGVLILMDTALCLIENEEPVYPLEIVKVMREQRAMMIQNASQYRFACECVYAAFMRRALQSKKEEVEENG
ncbi:tyrosine-protein phosphatase non-receptor type 4 [Coccinella septempunctata]|uniref:tyrosine-protein phosphatase non-receptor type 4 n=1 Tax=Coccinella septempunctata TaxID=41139 RepID=UPI001D09295F|nr:tyrosine-protein phosphatase non-receptor type 4 [Coccinella septempunctata]XP_044760651.1 tyrosine-protein phosphatase non-receptor type 4 [Coccinella septempunctata]